MNVLVKDNSPDQLRIVLKPNGCAYVGGGLAFIIAGCFTLWMLGVQVELKVEDGALSYSSRQLGLVQRKQFSIPNPEIADVSLVLKEGLAPIYKVTVTTADASYEADLPMSDGDEKRAIIEQILTAIAAPDGSFHYDENGIIGSVLLGGVCIVGGVICLLCLQTVSIRANRPIGYLRIHRCRRLWPGGDVTEIELGDYRDIRKKRFTVETGRGQNATSYHVQIRRKGGDPIPVAHGPMFTEKSADELIRLVEDWIAGAPSCDPGTPTQ